MSSPNPTRNQLILVGYAADAPEISATPSGTLVARLALYTRHVYKRDGQEVVETDRHTVVAYGEKAHAAQRVRKGSLVEIHGRLKQESWQDRETGQTRFATRIIANDLAIKLLAPPSEEWREAPNVRRKRTRASP
jgi:single-strand DNA-binding protein